MKRIIDQSTISSLLSMRVGGHVFWGLTDKFGDGKAITMRNESEEIKFLTGSFVEFIIMLPTILPSEWIEVISDPEIESEFISLLNDAANRYSHG